MADRHDLFEPQAMAEMVARVRRSFEESIEVKRQVIDHHAESIVRIAQTVAQTLSRGGKLLLCGNGGSAADAQHLAAELLIRLRPHVNREAIPALALATDPSSLTACGNDFDFETYFERMTRALGVRGDVLLGITTSGKSENVIRALRAAREKGMIAVGFLGGDGGPALAECDLALVVPSCVTGRIQESHIAAGHVVMELVEDYLLENGFFRKLGEGAH
jgi:D-sedoheptulose 7-phosphate isomerase